MKDMKLKTSRSQRAFTLAELMVVIVIIGLLATLVVPQIVDKIFTANIGVAKAQVASLSSAIQNFQIKNNGKLPESLEDLVRPDENGVAYLRDAERVPLDPWGGEYFYKPDGNGVTFEVGTYGKDGQPGGEGDSADISNKTLANERSKKQ